MYPSAFSSGPGILADYGSAWISERAKRRFGVQDEQHPWCHRCAQIVRFGAWRLLHRTIRGGRGPPLLSAGPASQSEVFRRAACHERVAIDLERAMRGGDRTDDGQAQADASTVAGPVGGEPAERLAQGGQLPGRDAWAGVADGERGPGLGVSPRPRRRTPVPAAPPAPAGPAPPLRRSRRRRGCGRR